MVWSSFNIFPECISFWLSAGKSPRACSIAVFTSANVFESSTSTEKFFPSKVLTLSFISPKSFAYTLCHQILKMNHRSTIPYERLELERYQSIRITIHWSNECRSYGFLEVC
mmetsp:Transcript_5533/g.7635  ORF Transcript_5533/g.7635 Transcript_5533/m.7635 type:complete len:112 (-) Transcript_5533:53-388(-)